MVLSKNSSAKKIEFEGELNMSKTVRCRLMTDAEWLKWDAALSSAQESTINIDAALYLELIRQGAKSGVAVAQRCVGDVYKDGFGDSILPNLSEAVKWYKAAADQSNYLALKTLIALYQEGQIPLTELADVIKSVSGEIITEPDVLYIIGIMHYEGVGVEKSPQLAFKYIKKAAKSQNLEASMKLVDFYLTGYSHVDPDPEKAIELLKEMSDFDYAPAIYKLAQLYEQGVGSEGEKYRKAFKLYKKAAKLNHEASILKLCEYYRKGIGTEKNKKKAEKWKSKLYRSEDKYIIPINA